MKAQPQSPCEVRNGSVVQINGRVRKPLLVSMEELCKMESEVLEDLFVVCGSGDPRGSIGSCRGVLLEDLIRKADVIKEEHDDTKKMFPLPRLPTATRWSFPGRRFSILRSAVGS